MSTRRLKYKDIVILTAQLSVIVPVMMGIIRWKYLNKTYLWMLAYVLTAMFTEIASEITAGLGNNTFMFHIDSVMQFSTLIPFFYTFLKSSRVRKLLIAAYLVFFAIVFIEVYFLTGWFQYNSITRIYSSLVLISCAVYVISQLSLNVKLVNVHTRPIYWFVMAVLGYFMANFIIFSLGRSVQQTSIIQFLITHRIHLIILILARLIIGYGFYCIPRTKHLW